MDLYLLRHGESEANAGITEHLDSPLTARGREQARRAGERLRHAGLTRIYVSPLRRTLQTIAPVCEATGLRAELYADVCEYFSWEEYREFPGMSPAAILEEFPFMDIGETFPCGDTWWPRELEDVAAIRARSDRVRDALLRLYAHTEAQLLIVSHADPIGRLIESFLHQPSDPDGPDWIENCALTRLACSPDPGKPAVLVYRNDTAHLQ